MATQNSDHTWNVSPRAAQYRRFSWDGGTFETARRPHTASVEGEISSARPIVMATLRGGARRHEFVTDCGYRYAGQDRSGMVSFLPAGCRRRLLLRDVQWEWASLALTPGLIADLHGAEPPPFSSAQDPFLFGLLRELERLLTVDGALDPAYCDTVSLAVAHYLRRRYGGSGTGQEERRAALSARHLRRIADYIEAHLDEEVRISALAGLVGLSEGHLHRAFRAATGQTPLQFLNERRVQRAVRILAEEPPVTIVEVALRVGFVSPSHFARVFRGVTGENPSRYRRAG